MPVIALTQEMGSLAKEVADGLAAELQLEVMRHEVLDHVADRMHVARSLISRLREGQAGTLERLRADRASMAVYTAEEVFERAERGNVVLRGWGATCLLRPVPHIVCVRITRSLAARVEWLHTHLGTDDAEHAEAEIRRSDRAHAANMNAQFGVTWGDPLLYDMVLNTDRITVEGCIAQIRALSARPEFAETDASRGRLKAMALEARIRAALKGDEATRDVDVTIDIVDSRVTLRGIVLDPGERPSAIRVVAAVPGVTGVDDQLRVMAKSRLFPSAKN